MPQGWALRNCHCASISSGGLPQWLPPWSQSTAKPPSEATFEASLRLVVVNSMITMSTPIAPWAVITAGTWL